MIDPKFLEMILILTLSLHCSKSQLRYTCTNKGEVKCQNGWTSVNDTDPLHPCATPLCSDGCVHGKCDPDVCACDIGWYAPNPV